MTVMTNAEQLSPATDTVAGEKPDEFNESAPVQPGTEVEPNAPSESPTAPSPTPAIPAAPTDQGSNVDPNDRVQSQNDEDAQAQTVADDAIRGLANDPAYSEDSKHGGTTNPAQIIPDDQQDVVDHMQQMERSGTIDMGAFEGERNDDDESGMLGEGGMEPGDLDEHGNPARQSSIGVE